MQVTNENDFYSKINEQLRNVIGLMNLQGEFTMFMRRLIASLQRENVASNAKSAFYSILSDQEV